MTFAEYSMSCHRYEAIRPPKRSERWRHLFLECGQCRGPKILASITVLNPADPLRIWVCVPCQRRSYEEVKRAILTCEICNTDEHSTMKCPNTRHIVTTFESRNDRH
jgi:hypothetical protein